MFREFADHAKLSQLREVHLDHARRWEKLAIDIELDEKARELNRISGEGLAGLKDVQDSPDLMSRAADYRGYATKTRAKAEKAISASERDALQRAALRWDMLAEELERTSVQINQFRLP